MNGGRKTLDACTIPLSGRHVIEASAGTGKTYTITTLCLRLLVEVPKMKVDNLLVVTFTNAAAEELRGRIRERLRQALEAVRAGEAPSDPVLQRLLDRWEHDRAAEKLADALDDFDLARIGTIHSFCQRVLSENALASGVQIGAEMSVHLDRYREEAANDLLLELINAEPDFVRGYRRKSLNETLLTWVKRWVDVGTELVRPQVIPANPPLQRPGLAKRWTDLLIELHELLSSEGDAYREWLNGCVAQKILSGSKYRGAPYTSWPRPLLKLLNDHRLPNKKDVSKLTSWSPQRIEEAVNARKVLPAFPALRLTDALNEFAELLPEVLEEMEHSHQRVAKWVIERAPEALERAKAGSAHLFFDDLLSLVHQAVTPEGSSLAKSLRARFPVAMVDEFQDTDKIQWEIFDSIYRSADSRLFLIGDPKQAIYRFRGADLQVYLQARDTAGDQVWDMETNWRSDGPMVDAVNQLFLKTESPFGGNQIQYTEVKAHHQEPRLLVNGEPVAPLQFLLHTGRTEDRSRDTASEVLALVQSEAEIIEGDSKRRLTPGDVAVLVRGHRKAKEYCEALQALGLPAVIRGKKGVWSAHEAEEVRALLDWLLHPRDPRRLRAVQVGAFFEVSSRKLEEFSQEGRLYAQTLDLGETLHGLWERMGVMAMYQELLRLTASEGRWMGRLGGARTLTNLLHIMEMCHGEEQRHRLGTYGLYHWVVDQMAKAAQNNDEAQLRLATDAGAVQVVTMHSSKGLEYPVVFCPNLCDPGKEPGRDAVVSIPADPDQPSGPMRRLVDLTEGHLDLARQEEAEELVRLAYVALTRAKHRCVISVQKVRGGSKVPMAPLYALLPGSAGSTKKEEAMMDFFGKCCADQPNWACSVPSGARTSAYVAPKVELETRPCRTAAGDLTKDLAIASFSSMVRGSGHHGGSTYRGASEDGQTLPLMSLPRGPEAGTLVHHILETLDFQDVARSDERVRQELSAAGRVGTQVLESLTEGLQQLVSTSLLPDGTCLADIPREHRLDEMEFWLPVGSEQRHLTPKALGGAFAAHGSTPAVRAFSEKVSHLDFEPLHGFLTGSIDLVFLHDGRWYVVDYKTNFLGEVGEAYRGAHLEQAMEDGNYFLQYHLYTLALHRYLRSRVSGYDYERDFGGVLYLFLRGMTENTGPTQGVFYDRPSQEMLETLDGVFSPTPQEVAP